MVRHQAADHQVSIVTARKAMRVSRVHLPILLACSDLRALRRIGNWSLVADDAPTAPPTALPAKPIVDPSTTLFARRLLNAERGLVKSLGNVIAHFQPVREPFRRLVPIRLFKHQRCNQVRQACEAADFDLKIAIRLGACPQCHSVRIGKAAWVPRDKAVNHLPTTGTGFSERVIHSASYRDLSTNYIHLPPMRCRSSFPNSLQQSTN